MAILSRFVIKRYKEIIVLWVVLTAVMAFFAVQLPDKLRGDGFQMEGEHATVMDIVSDTFHLPAKTLFLVFEKADDEKITETIEKVERLGVASDIVSPLKDSNFYKGDIAYARLHFHQKELNMSEVVSDIEKTIDGQVGMTLTGAEAISKDINSASQVDLMRAEAIGLPIAIIVLLFAFGSVAASIIPLIIGLSTVIISFGVLTLLSKQMDFSIFILNIIPMLGLALSIDFALLFISRYREEQKKGNLVEAVSITIQTAGRAVLFSALCVFIGLSAMLFIKVDIFQNIALSGMVVVALSVLSSITLLPSMLVLLGEGINKWHVLKVKHKSDWWRAFAQHVIRKPIRITILSVIILGFTLIPAQNIVLTIPNKDALPVSYDSRAAFDKIERVFDLEEKSTVYIVAEKADGWENEKGYEKIKELEEKFLSDPLVEEVTSVYSMSGIGSVAGWKEAWKSQDKGPTLEPIWEQFVQDTQLLMPVTLSAKGDSSEAQQWVRNLADEDFLIGGKAKFSQEIFDEIAHKLWLVLTVIVMSTFLILLIAFRSLLIPVKAILMNIIGISATFGVLVYIFQYGHFGLEAGTISLIIPVIVFSLVFGLSMDYEVFLISRMQEEYAKTLDNDHSTVEGLATTSKIISSAALIMIVLTGSFAFTDVMPVKQIGVGIAVAVAIDATIIRLLLVPSLMKLFGDWNWWLPFRKGPYRAGKLH